MTQTEIHVPAQPPRITLHRARAMRDELEKQMATERPQLAVDVTAIALQFHGADGVYRRVRPAFYRKRTLDRLHSLGRLIAALEAKRAH